METVLNLLILAGIVCFVAFNGGIVLNGLRVTFHWGGGEHFPLNSGAFWGWGVLAAVLANLIFPVCFFIALWRLLFERDEKRREGR